MACEVKNWRSKDCVMEEIKNYENIMFLRHY